MNVPTTEPNRQPLTTDVVLSQTMEKLQVDTPTDMLAAVTDLVDKVAFWEDSPAPLLVVDHQGRITLHKDLTVYGLTQIVDALRNMRVAGGGQ